MGRGWQGGGMDRDENLGRLGGERWDIVIIGGGATGLGAAVEAAARGWRVVVVERDDFAKGTSSRSTKLVHGGLRYLKQGNVGLVKEALRERGRLARNAPHLVRDREFVIPLYRWWEGTFYGAGLKVYDQMAGALGFAPSRRLGREETIARLPTVSREGLRGGVLYYDGQFDDARLALALARTASGLGAVVVNHCEVTGLLKSKGGELEGVKARDEESGRQWEVRGRVVVNATGVFVDEMRRRDDSQARKLVAVSQGIHLVLPKVFLPGQAALMVPKTADGRVLFAVPWCDRVVVGTTDTPVAGPVVEPRAREEERAFVLTHVGRYLGRRPKEEEVLSVFAGLRPLVASGGEGKGTAGLARDHRLEVSGSGLVTVTGGKWTTYRQMGEEVIDAVEAKAGWERRGSRTAELRLWGWVRTGTEGEVYGAEMAEVEALVEGSEGGGARLHPRLPYREGEVRWHARREMARTVEDVLARRTRALFLDARAAREAAPRVAALLAAELGRDAGWERAQVAGFDELARGYIFEDGLSTGVAG